MNCFVVLLTSHLEASESPRLMSLVILSQGSLQCPQAAKEVLPSSLVSFLPQPEENAAWVKTHGLGRTSSGYNLLCHCDATVMRTAPAARVPVFPEGKMLVMTLLSHIAVPTTPLTRFHRAKLRMSSHLDVGLRHFHFKHPASS